MQAEKIGKQREEEEGGHNVIWKKTVEVCLLFYIRKEKQGGKEEPSIALY
jgi:hypothetical protein